MELRAGGSWNRSWQAVLRATCAGNLNPARVRIRKSTPCGDMVSHAPGWRAVQVGPLVAIGPQVAEQLMERLLRHFGESEMIADVVAENRSVRDLLERHDFAPDRQLVRMFRGPNAFPGRPCYVARPVAEISGSRCLKLGHKRKWDESD